MSQREFDAECKKRGFEPFTCGLLGYYHMTVKGRQVGASIFNAGPRRRDQLAYLIKVQRDFEKELGA